MILIRNRNFKLILWLLFIYFNHDIQLFSQKKSIPPFKSFTEQNLSRQDTALELRNRNALTAEEPDTNFTWEKYAAFLNKISDTSKYIVLPLNEFRKTFNSKKIVIGLRHDVDNSLNIAYQFSDIEYKLGFRSTYFILHTAPYYLANPNNMAVHAESIIPILKTMQNDRKFEIGWHNDLVTLQLIYKLNSVLFLHDELRWLRSNGINIIGTAAHGSNYCKIYHYMNFYFFYDCTWPIVQDREYNITVPIGTSKIPILKGNLSDFGLEYEAYFLNNNKAFSDATITNGIRWDIGMLNLNQLVAGDRVIILLHPIHWHQASTEASILGFWFEGQKYSEIDQANSLISVEMPYKSDLSHLMASFSVSPGAYAKVSGKMQTSDVSRNNFNDPVSYVVYSENRDIRKEWIVHVHLAKNDSCDFKSFVIPGITKSVNISYSYRTIELVVKAGANLRHLHTHFELPEGARAFIGEEQQVSDSGTVDFSRSVEYTILAEDGKSSSKWMVSVRRNSYHANFISFSIPGLLQQASIDTLTNTIILKINKDVKLNNVPVSFELSEGAHAWIGKQEQISDFSVLDLTQPVEYDIISNEGQITKRWKVTIIQKITQAENLIPDVDLKIYPNPSSGKIYMQFSNVLGYPTRIDIYDSRGEKVYMDLILKTGNFTAEADLSTFSPGIYIVKYSHSQKSYIVILRDH